MSDAQRSPEKPVDEWVTGDEPMTGPQQSYLETLAREAGEEVPADLTKAQASEMIDRLQSTTGRGQDSSSSGSSSSASARSTSEEIANEELPLDATAPTEFGDAAGEG
jgi:hypothetical protein